MAAYYEMLGDEAKTRAQSVAMDMFQGYLTPTQQHIPGAEHKGVHDRFHITESPTHGGEVSHVIFGA